MIYKLLTLWSLFFAGGATAWLTSAASSPTSTEATDVARFWRPESLFLPPLDVRDRVQASGPLAREPPDEPDPPVPESTEEALLRGMVANVVLKENILKTVFIFLTQHTYDPWWSLGQDCPVIPFFSGWQALHQGALNTLANPLDSWAPLYEYPKSRFFKSRSSMKTGLVFICY